MNLVRLDISNAIKGLAKKEFSATQLTQACLDRIEKLNPDLNAFVSVSAQEALDQATKADQLWEQGNPEKKTLLGIPIALKDMFCAKGLRTTASSNVLRNFISPYDATVVTRLKEAGAIIVGKTNQDAWAHGSSGENSDFGPTRNPWNRELVPGGSSSGSAVAVASELVLAATGTDTGGSIRFPASFCNVVGLKPTYGRVSRYGIIAMASSLDSIGHFTKTVTDSALLLQVTAGADGKDATCPARPIPPYLARLEQGVSGLKIGVPKEYFVEGMDKEVAQKVSEAIKTFENLGAEVVEVSLPYTKEAVATYYVIQCSEVSSNLARYDGVRYGSGRQDFGSETKRRIMLGTYALSSGYYDQYYLKAQKVRTLIKEDFTKAFDECDCLITPVSPTLPFRLGEKTDDPLKMYLSDIFTVTANLAGIPGLAIPAGFVRDLPVGIQLLGPQFSEELLFRVGFAYEQKTKYCERISPQSL